jgi:hypothetical protein
MNIKYKDGKTALQVSEELLGYFQQENPDLAKKYTEIVELLRSKGAS